MWYLFLQMYGWIFLAFALGFFTHWLLCCRGKKEDNRQAISTMPENSLDESETESSETNATLKATSNDADEQHKPQGFASRPEDSDELKRIKGIGAVIEETLNQLGIYQFDQIAAWNDDNIAWVEKSLAFPGRITREDWVSQAQTLSAGGTTEFAKRVDKGDINYR